MTLCNLLCSGKIFSHASSVQAKNKEDQNKCFSKHQDVYIEGLPRSDVIMGGIQISRRALLATYGFSELFFMLFRIPIPKPKTQQNPHEN